MSIEIVVNGERHTTAEGQTVLGLLQQLQLDPARVAVELNREIVRKPDWPTTPVPPGSQVEVVQFVGGG